MQCDSRMNFHSESPMGMGTYEVSSGISRGGNKQTKKQTNRWPCPPKVQSAHVGKMKQ